MDLSDQPGPSIAGDVAEVRGWFPDDARLEDAIARLTLAGFDRADISLPLANPGPGLATPEAGAALPTSDIDRQQMRTLHASGAGAAGALAAAGITIATGGAAAAAAGAALVVGAAAAGITSLATTASDHHEVDERNQAALEGHLVLSARVTDAAKQSAAEAAMRAAGATQVEPVHRLAASR